MCWYGRRLHACVDETYYRQSAAAYKYWDGPRIRTRTSKKGEAKRQKMVDRCATAGLEQSNQLFSLKTLWHVTAGKAQVNIKNEWRLNSFQLFQVRVHRSLHMLTLLCLTTALEWATAVLFLESGVKMSAVEKTWRSLWYFWSNTFSKLYINMHNSNFLSQMKNKCKKLFA